MFVTPQNCIDTNHKFNWHSQLYDFILNLGQLDNYLNYLNRLTATLLSKILNGIQTKLLERD